MIKGFCQPTPIDPRDRWFSFHRIFGSVHPNDIPDEYNADAGLTMPDQNAAGDYTECTAYTVTDSCTDQDGKIYNPDIQYALTLKVAGAPPTQQGANLRTAHKVPVALGLLEESKVPKPLKDAPQELAADWKLWPFELNAEMAKNKKPAFFAITGLFDKFDNIRSAMWISRDEKRTVNIGIPWYQEFNTVENHGILEENPTVIVGWHAPKVAGWTKKDTRGHLLRDGEVFLRIKAWQGPYYGDKGWVYVSRKLINKLRGTQGSAAFMFQKVSDGMISTLKAQRVTLLETAMAFAQNLLLTLRSKINRYG